MHEPEASDATWVFGYGSLMWNPGFEFASAHHARLDGYHRAFCVYSVHYRGSAKRPGLVLGLDRGGACEGIAFRLPRSSARESLAYLRERELIYGVYREARLPLSLIDGGAGRRVFATAFIAEHAHPAYAGHLHLETQIAIIRGARGVSGTNLDYMLNTLARLASLGIREPSLMRLAARAASFAAHGPCREGARPRAAALQEIAARVPIETPRMVRDHRFCHRAHLARLREASRAS